MKKIMKKCFAMIVSVMLIAALLPINAFAENWNSTDTITINVRVFDQNTGKVYAVGTDTVTKGDQYIQSDPYKIPNLSEFTSNSYGRVTKVAGNWYFPSGDSNVGATVYWSCNVNSVTMTYWVTSWSTGTGSGTASPGNEIVNYGSSTNYQWQQTIVYHSNYPNGTDVSYIVTYNIKNFVKSANYNLKTIAGCGFSLPDGYEMRTRVWDTAKDGTGADYGNGGNYPFSYNNSGKTIHLYAQWTPKGGTAVSSVTLTYKDGTEDYATQSFFAGDAATVIDCTNKKDGYTFKGWDTNSAANQVVYTAGSAFTIYANTVLYAVWEKDSVDYILRYDANGGKNAPEDQKIANADGSAAFSVSDVEPTRDGYVFAGWAETETGEVIYMAGDSLWLTSGAPEKTIYAVWKSRISFRGAAIRVPETYYMEKSAEENTEALSKTNLRFGYEIALPEGTGMKDVKWYWNWGTDEKNLNHEVAGSEFIELGENTYRTNLVITNIPIDTDYGTDIYSQLTLVYTNSEGETVTIVDPTVKRSVKFVAEKIYEAIEAGNSSETEKVQSYVTDLIGKVNDMNH